jgi:5-methylcytosine-specific restriction enzyme subunit McrC
MTPPLILREHELKPNVRLEAHQVVALRATLPSMPITPTGDEHTYELRPGSRVGIVRLPDLDVIIEPKITVGQVLFLWSYAANPRLWRDEPVQWLEHAWLHEAIAAAYVRLVQRATARGLLYGYRRREEALPTIRGAIRFADQLARRPGMMLPIEVTYDDFTADIVENQLLKAAGIQLRRLPMRNQTTRRDLRRLDATFDGVTATRFDVRALPVVPITRLNARYEPALALARLILQLTGFDVGVGSTVASGLLLNMNKVFEDFVTVALREALHLDRHRFPQNAKGRHLTLDNKGLIALEPDLSWWASDGRCIFVGDAKYKKLTPRGYEHADTYQALAYTVATRLPAALLVYGAGETTEADHFVPTVDKIIHVRTLDLEGTPHDILRQVQALADEVRTLAQDGVPVSRQSSPSFPPEPFVPTSHDTQTTPWVLTCPRR